MGGVVDGLKPGLEVQGLVGAEHGEACASPPPALVDQLRAVLRGAVVAFHDARVADDVDHAHQLHAEGGVGGAGPGQAFHTPGLLVLAHELVADEHGQDRQLAQRAAEPFEVHRGVPVLLHGGADRSARGLLEQPAVGLTDGVQDDRLGDVLARLERGDGVDQGRQALDVGLHDPSLRVLGAGVEGRVGQVGVQEQGAQARRARARRLTGLGRTVEQDVGVLHALAGAARTAGSSDSFADDSWGAELVETSGTLDTGLACRL